MKSKVFKTILVSSIILLTGCMPDSLTKFKQETKPQKSVSGGTTTQDTAPSALSYSKSTYQFTVSNPIVAQSPTVTGEVVSYSISPALPAGLALDTTTGRLYGTPTVFAAATNHVITATNTAGSTTATINISAFNQPAGLKYNLQARSIITMSSASALSVGGSFTTATGVGVVKQLAGNVAEVEVSSGYFVLGQTVTETTVQTIDELDYKNAVQIFPVNSANIVNFTVGGFVSSPASQGSSLGIVKQLLSDSIVVDIVRGTFAPTETLDNVATYAATDMTVDKVNYVLENGDSIDLRPTITAGESISYALASGALPSGFTTFTDSSGYIIGTYSTSATTQVTVEATNPVGSVSSTFTMGPLIATPQYLSVTQNVVLKVLDTSSFEYGKKVTTPDSDLGQVLQVIDGEYLYVRVLGGSFEKDESLDNSIPFGGEKTSVLDVKHVSVVLEVPDGGATNFLRDGYISSNTGGRGIVSHIFADGANPDKIFVRHSVAGFAADSVTPVQIDNTTTFAAAETTISRVRSNNLEIFLTSVASFSKGIAVTYESGTTYASGWVHDTSTPSNSMTIRVSREGFHYDVGPDNVNPFVATESPVSSYRADNTIYLRTGEATRLNTTLLAGNDIEFTVVPDLPPGISLDSETGVISGTPEQSSVKKSYTLSATNTVGGVPQITNFSFNIKVYDVFSLANITPNATSYVLHKAGKGNEIADCLVTQEQVASSNQSQKDITCMMEGGELDLYQLGLGARVFSSKGMCKYVSTRPYGFWKYPYKKTTTNNVKLVVNGSCSAGVRTQSNTDGSSFRCHSDYSADSSFLGGPNCDDGRYTEVTINYNDDTTPNPDGTCDSFTVTSNIRDCGGQKYACYGGSQKEEFSEGQLAAGIRSTIFNATEGAAVEYTITSPLNQGLITNRNLVNYTANNSCTDADGYNPNNTNWRAYADQFVSRTLSGTISSGATYSSTVTGVGTLFTEELINGDSINVGGQSYVILSITDDTNLILANPINTTFAGQTYTLSAYNSPLTAGAEPFYEFACLDAAYDTIARIRMLVREWDRDFKITDSIDRLQIPLSGTVATTAASTTATGAGTSFDTEVISERMIKIGTEVSTVDSVTNATALELYLNSTLTQAGATAYIRPPLSDAGDATDLFGNPWNNRSDWDDRRSNYHPSLNGCSVGTPTQTNSSGASLLRLFDYRFMYDGL
tara:strand:+ start:41883 stop:45464 length:3582 start_codon:yes stop_codon:yes gene_type:complete